MKDELIADIWTLVSEHVAEKARKELAEDFINTLLDHGIKESVLSSLIGVDTVLDEAIEYALDGGDPDEDEEEDYVYDDE